MKCHSLLLMVSLLHIVAGGIHRRQLTKATSKDCNDLQVSIVVSSLNENSKPRQLIVSWDNANPVDGDWIGLFNTDPQQDSCNPLYKSFPKNSSGWEVTHVYEVAVSSSKLGFTKTCTGFWIAYLTKDDTIKVKSCLQTEPRWMNDMKTDLSPLIIRKLFLPGTHDSGSYKDYTASEGENLVFKYTITQEEDVLSQLIHGVRYLDIRVGYNVHSSEKWFLNHGIISIRPLKTVFDEVKTFLENTNEIVVMDFHEFPQGFGSDLTVHETFVQFIKQELGSHAASSSLTWNAKLADIWSQGKRLILSYNKNELVAKHDILWQAVNQKWGNVRTLDDLYSYISSVMAKPPANNGWAAMAELTPTGVDVITDGLGGLRKMADMVNHNVTLWFQGTWGQTVNIVAVDYFRGTTIVDSAIKWNKRNAQGIKCSFK